MVLLLLYSDVVSLLSLRRSYIALSGGSGNATDLPYADNLFDAIPPPSHPLDSIPIDDFGALQSSCEEFIPLFREREGMAWKNLPTSSADGLNIQKIPNRKAVFKQGTQLHRLLSMPARICPGCKRVKTQRSIDCSRMACLLYFNLVMINYRDFSEKTEAFLGKLSEFLNDEESVWSLSPEHLLWPVLRGIEEPGHARPERAWLVTR